MLATAFDPLAAARELKAAGFESEQAEALAAQLRFAAGADHADLATKADVEALKGDIGALRAATKADIGALKGDIDALRTDTKADIGALKGDIDALRTTTKADIAETESRLRADLVETETRLRADLVETETRLRTAVQADIAGIRAELGTVRWAVGLIAAFLFVIGIRVFGLI